MFAENLKKIRTEKGITQAELADAIEVARSTIGMYESGKREPNFDMAEAIAEYLNVPLSTLLSKSDIKKSLTQNTYDDIKIAFFNDATVPDELMDKARAFAGFLYDSWKAKQNEDKKNESNE